MGLDPATAYCYGSRAMQRVLVSLCAFLILGLASSASAERAPYEETHKTHSWISFSRPAEKTAARQLARADKFKSKGKLKAACRAYHALVVTWPGSTEAPGAELNYAELLEKRGKFADAFDEYQY